MTEVLENPIVGDPERLSKINEEVDKRIEYSKAYVEDAKRRGVYDKLPKTSGELRKGLEEKAQAIAEGTEQEDREKREERARKVPDIVLRLKDESFWEQIGWGERERTDVRGKLKEKLQIESDQSVENALQCVVASGKSPQEVLDALEHIPAFDSYPPEGDPENRKIQDLLQRNDSRLVLGGDPRLARKVLFIQEKLGVTNVKYIYRFILNDDLHEGLNDDRNTRPAENIFDIAWNIMTYINKDKYAMDGNFPLLQMQIKLKKDAAGNLIEKRNADGTPMKTRDGKPIYEVEKGRYVLNEANFVKWVRGRMFERWDKIETDDPVDFYNVLDVYKGQYSTINLLAMIFDDERYFRDETDYKFDALFDQIFIEPFMLIWDRNYAIQYKNAMGNADDLVKAYKAMADLSKWTRKINGQSMLDRSLMLPVDFIGKDSDASAGDGLNTMFLTLYNIADYGALKQILGEDSDFFKMQTWIDAAKTVAGKTMRQTGGAWMSHIFGQRQDDFYAAFDVDTGKVKDSKAFIRLVNPYNQEQAPQTLVKALEEVVKNSVEDKFISKQAGLDKDGNPIIDKDSRNYAWLKAYSWMYFTGGVAKNNWVDKGGPAGWLEQSKWEHANAYRWKYGTFAGNGNPLTTFMFKRFNLSLLEGMILEDAFERAFEGFDADGNPKFNEKKMKKQRYRTPMEVMLEMRQVNAEFERKLKPLQDQLKDATLSDTERKRIETEIALIEDEAKNTSKAWASRLEFNDNSMTIWAKNLLARGAHLYNVVMKGQETDFDKFMTYSGPFKGVTFKRADWQSAIQETYVTPLRYFFEANGATQLNMKVRAPVQVGWSNDENPQPLWEWQEQYLGESMLGHQIVDIPELRFLAKDVKDWRLAKKEGFRKKGEYVVDRDGNHVIDWDKAQEHKTLVWKQWLLMKIAADLLTHVDRHSTDPSYSMDHYEKILTAIRELPGNILGNELNMGDTVIGEHFFSEEQMEWLENLAKVTPILLYNRQFWTDILRGDPHKKTSGVGESASIILSTIFRGK